MEHFAKIIDEFRSQKAPERFRYALKVSQGFTDAELLFKLLADSLDRHMRRTGLRLDDVKLFAEKFDFANKLGVGFEARLKKSEDGRLALFVGNRYEQLLAQAMAERGEMAELLVQVGRSQKMATARAKIARGLGRRP